MQKSHNTAFAIYAIVGKDQKFGTQDQLFKDIAKLADEREMDFFILVPGFSKSLTTGIEGYRLQGIGDFDVKWHKEKVIWPQAVLRRMVHYPSSMKNLVQHEEQLLEKKSQLMTLPRRLGNKWRGYQLLQKDPSLRAFLPKTIMMKTARDIYPYLETMPDLYIKPVLGSQGSRVMRIQRAADVFLLAASQTGVMQFSHQDSTGLVQEVNERLLGQAAVVQETIPLMHTMAEESIDLRYLVQVVPGQDRPYVLPIARVGKKKSVTTNLHTGGRALSCKQIAEYLPSDQVQAWQRGVDRGKTLARKVFRSFQKEYPLLSELGIDIAMDEAGRVYWLEINPCPGRRMVRAVSPDWRMMSLLRMVDYAKYLVTRTS